MDTNGTGHDRCPSQCPGPCGARTPPFFGGEEKISKVVFGFKRVSKNFFKTDEGGRSPGFINKLPKELPH